jgi:hypothetical protein
MNTEELKEIAVEYVASNKAQAVAEQGIADAFSLLNPENTILSLSDNITDAYSSLTEKVLGSELMEWIYWWIYECDYGRKSMVLSIDADDYDVVDLTFEKFFDLISY